MMNKADNPYFNRLAIQDDHDFFGRRRELATIFSRIDAGQPQSVSVLGERSMGKSSLLRALLRQRTTSLRRPDEYIFVFLDLGMRYADVPGFFAALMEKIALACNDPAIGDLPPTYENVRKLVTSLTRKPMRLVLLLDEFEAITQNQNFTLEFFSFLRSLPNNYPVSFIVTSARELHEICHSEEVAGSPFFNIFHKLNLGCFQPEEARELVEQPSLAAGYPLQPYTAFIFRMAGYFPFFIQMACSKFFDLRQQNLENGDPDLTVIWQMFYEEARDHIEYLWDHLSEREQTVCLNVSGKKDLSEAEQRFLDKLSRRGYVEKSASGVRLFSDVFDAFLQTKTPVRATSAPLRGQVGIRTRRPGKDKSADELLKERQRIDEQLREKFVQQIAILYVDLVGSTEFSEKHGAIELCNRIRRMEEHVTPILGRCGGEKVKLVGDAVIARFNRAEDAVAAGIGIKEEFARRNFSDSDPIRVKIAINYGEALMVDGDVYGDAINTAERVLRETTADEVRISEFVLKELEPTRVALFVNKGEFSLKGKAHPVQLFCYRELSLGHAET